MTDTPKKPSSLIRTLFDLGPVMTVALVENKDCDEWGEDEPYHLILNGVKIVSRIDDYVTLDLDGRGQGLIRLRANLRDRCIEYDKFLKKEVRDLTEYERLKKKFG